MGIFIFIICITIMQVLVNHLFAALFSVVTELLKLAFVLSPTLRLFFDYYMQSRRTLTTDCALVES